MILTNAIISMIEELQNNQVIYSLNISSSILQIFIFLNHKFSLNKNIYLLNFDIISHEMKKMKIKKCQSITQNSNFLMSLLCLILKIIKLIFNIFIK
jgi:hypothetical protein